MERPLSELKPGAAMRVKRRAPLGDPLEVSLRGYDLALRAEDACKILVREAGA